MRPALSKDHFEYFNKNHFLELESLFSHAEIEAVAEEADQILAKRLQTDTLEKKTPTELYSAGRDLWREGEKLKKLALNFDLVNLGSQLSRTKPLRIGYTQIFRTLGTAEECPWFQEDYRLGQSSSFRDVAFGVFIDLRNTEIREESPILSVEEDSTILTPFPTAQGNLLYVDPSMPLNVQPFFNTPNHAILLIAFCTERAIYTKNDEDPLTHEGKKLGYVFGDSLTEANNPIVFR